MNQFNQLRDEAEQILKTLSPANANAVQRLLSRALDEVLKAVKEGTHASLASWASRQADENVHAAIFVSCTAALRLIDRLQPSQFAAVDRLLLSARHAIAREVRVMAA